MRHSSIQKAEGSIIFGGRVGESLRDFLPGSEIAAALRNQAFGTNVCTLAGVVLSRCRVAESMLNTKFSLAIHAFNAASSAKAGSHAPGKKKRSACKSSSGVAAAKKQTAHERDDVMQCRSAEKRASIRPKYPLAFLARR